MLIYSSPIFARVGLLPLHRLASSHSIPRITMRSPKVSIIHIPKSTTSDAESAATAQSTSFSHLGLHSDVQLALSKIGINEPTEIQAKSFSSITKGGDFILASHTGSGKTLAFLLPIITLLKEEEARGFVPRPKRPRALILGPTKELAEQIAGVAKTLSHDARFRSTCLTGSRTKRQQRVPLSGPMDIVVATPTRFLQHVKEGNVFLKDISWLVVDEADTILADQNWATELRQILLPLRARPDRPKANVVLVSATMNKPMRRLISTDFPGVQVIETSSLHKGIAGSRHRFVTIPPGRDKMDLLDDILAPEARALNKVLVFCNTVDSCRALEHHCREQGIPTVCYHGDMPVNLRQEAMRHFAGNSIHQEEEEEGEEEESEGGELITSSSKASPSTSPRQSIPVMIATDVAARGLDFPGTVDHVINFDFPLNTIDYIHRGGRTARAGKTGKVSSIVGPKDRVLADRIEWALGHGESLDQLSSDPKSLPPSQRPKPGKGQEGARDSRGRPLTRGSAAGGRGGRGGSSESRAGRRGAARFEGADSSRESSSSGRGLSGGRGGRGAGGRGGRGSGGPQAGRGKSSGGK